MACLEGGLCSKLDAVRAGKKMLAKLDDILDRHIAAKKFPASMNSPVGPLPLPIRLPSLSHF